MTNEPLHVVFVPLLAHGHMIPLCDIVRLFAARGVKATLVTTPGNAAALIKELNNTNNKAVDINLELIKFPSEKVGLPAGIENFGDVNSTDALDKLIKGIQLLRAPLEEVMTRLRPRPSCVVSDLCLPWTAEVAAGFGIPRLVFHGSCYFAVSIMSALRRHKPFLEVESESEEFVVPGLPHEIRLTKSRMPPWMKEVKGDVTLRMLEGAFEAEEKSYGVIMNTVHELEAEYVDYFHKDRGIKSWSIGPVSVYNRNTGFKTDRGKEATIAVEECKRWLDSKPPNSVVYIAFGSIRKMCKAGMREVAMALDSLDKYFIWVVRRPVDATTNTIEEWLPSGFETRHQGKGLIVKGWSPQAMILDHEATGVFFTHCGWNSTLEGISGGLSFVTWPAIGEQFLNEKLITDVMKIGVSIGASDYWEKCGNGKEVVVGKEAIEAALRRVTEGVEATKIRSRAQKLKELALDAIKEGGSSHRGLDALLEELKAFQGQDEF